MSIYIDECKLESGENEFRCLYVGDYPSLYINCWCESDFEIILKYGISEEYLDGQSQKEILDGKKSHRFESKVRGNYLKIIIIVENNINKFKINVVSVKSIGENNIINQGDRNGGINSNDDSVEIHGRSNGGRQLPISVDASGRIVISPLSSDKHFVSVIGNVENEKSDKILTKILEEMRIYHNEEKSRNKEMCDRIDDLSNVVVQILRAIEFSNELLSK